MSYMPRTATDARYIESGEAAGGDLSGIFPSPQIATGSIVNADVNASAAIATSKISGLDTSLAEKVAKTGDTMTGDLTINKANPYLIFRGGSGYQLIYWPELDAYIYANAAIGQGIITFGRDGGSGWTNIKCGTITAQGNITLNSGDLIVRDIYNSPQNLAIFMYNNQFYFANGAWSVYQPINVGAPTSADHAVTKNYIEGGGSYGATTSGVIANGSIAGLGLSPYANTGVTCDGWYLTLSKTGYWSVSCKVGYASAFLYNQRAFIDIRTTADGTIARSSWGTDEDGQSVSATFYQAAGNQVYFQVYQNSGGSRTINAGVYALKYLGVG